MAIQLDGYRCQNREGEQLESESDQEADEPMVADDHAGPWTHLIDSLHEEINNALRREHFRDASELQRMVLIIMDNLNAGNLRIDAAKKINSPGICKPVGEHDAPAQNSPFSTCTKIPRPRRDS